MKKLFLVLLCSTLAAAGALAQSQSLVLSTSGTGTTSGMFNAGSAFSLDTTLTFSGYTSNGLSYWLEVPAALAPFLTITSEQYFTFLDSSNPGPKTFSSSSGAGVGFLSDQGASDAGDLGATSVSAAFDVVAGTYLVTTLNFSLSSSAPIGTYTIRTTTLSPKISEVGDNTFVAHNLAGSSYTLTVVPEPSTIALLVGGVGLLATRFIRRNRRA